MLSSPCRIQQNNQERQCTGSFCFLICWNTSCDLSPSQNSRDGAVEVLKVGVQSLFFIFKNNQERNWLVQHVQRLFRNLERNSTHVSYTSNQISIRRCHVLSPRKQEHVCYALTYLSNSVHLSKSRSQIIARVHELFKFLKVWY